MGAVLAEMETIEENQDVVAHIQTNSNLKGKKLYYIVPKNTTTAIYTQYNELF